ncbi:ParB N-terminal domain-containing protein [Gorillibacterium massiliense]|uniref:ParB N-terminal domain-containing protein n=1 Tax=Gorillibacterium massiliense TaxID=1280390 RepID=UPI001EE2F08A|nr:ParB N-terminal domain-containing protein [Gorillibacterium massiliense]
MKFTAEEAIQFSKYGCIEEWVHIFLKTIGNNSSFSDGLKLQKRYWLGPIQLSVSELQRCCGPEEHMEYHNPLDDWEKHIETFCDLIQKGWEYPPLIVQHLEGKLIIRDGNHRHEALRRLHYQNCWVILWDSDNPSNLSRWSRLDE